LSSTADATSSSQLPPLRLGPKPSDTAPERLAHSQPTLPEGVQEIPFIETSPEPVLTKEETARGYILFQRPITESIYPNTRPHADERLDSLVAFATPGEFEPVSFALYPVRPLKNLKVRVSALGCSAGEIPPTESMRGWPPIGTSVFLRTLPLTPAASCRSCSSESPSTPRRQTNASGTGSPCMSPKTARPAFTAEP